MSKHILVVDDVDDDVRVMVDIIEHVMHHTTTAATGGEEAIRLAKESKPDLILMDLILPQLNGWEVAAELRQMDEFRDTPIIAVTSYNNEIAGLRDLARAGGCNDYLTKPFDIETFIEVINSHLPA